MPVVLPVEIAEISRAPPWWWSITLSSIASALFATLGAGFAVYFDRKKTVNSELIKKRIAIYDQMVPKSNELFCYFLCVGNWKSLTPDKLIDNKRELDKSAHIYGPLFSPELGQRYHKFIHCCFSTYTGAGKAAALRADLVYLKCQWKTDWNSEWDKYFSGQFKPADDGELQQSYNAFLDQFAIEIGARKSRARVR